MIGRLSTGRSERGIGAENVTPASPNAGPWPEHPDDVMLTRFPSSRLLMAGGSGSLRPQVASCAGRDASDTRLSPSPETDVPAP